MAEQQRAKFSNGPSTVDELFTEANIVALNEVLLERSISPERIISILTVPGQTLVNPTPAQFRVLYRAA